MADSRLTRAGALSLLMLGACRSEPPAAQPRWLGGQPVSSLGDGECAIFEQGRLRCQSLHAAGPSLSNKPVRALESSQFSLWTARCALHDDGTVACWGCCPSSWCYPLGIERSLPGERPPRREPLHVVPVRGAKQVTLARGGACALLDSGEVWCWGFSRRDNDTTNLGICHPQDEGAPRRVEGFPRMERIALALDGRLCGVTPGGDVHCEGEWYSSDELAWLERNPGQKLAEKGVHRVVLPPARDVVAGEHHFCALGREGSVSCWGDNTFEQCGAPRSRCIVPHQFVCRVRPNRVQLSSQAVAVSAGAEHSCALLENGRVSCWGRNQHGALGFASNQRCEPCFKGFCDRVPGLVAGVDDIVEIHASRSSRRTWALTDGGQVLVWPDFSSRGFEPRPSCPCDEREPTITSEQALLGARAVEKQKVVHLTSNTVRVRGHVSTISLHGREFSALGELVVEPLTIEPVDDQEVVVTGSVRRFRVKPGTPEVWSLHALHACGIFPQR